MSEKLNIIDQAVAVATFAHDGQYRKGEGGAPYITHPLRVGDQLRRMTDDPEIIAGGVMHDVLEDAVDRYDSEQMYRDFGATVLSYVQGVSEEKTRDGQKLPWRERKEAYLAHLSEASEGARMISAADKLDNLLSTLADHAQIGDAVWDRFKAGKEEQLWFYESVAATLRQSGLEGVVMDDFDRAVEELKDILHPEVES